MTCKLFGLPKAKRLLISSQGANEWSNIKRNIEQHELLPEHLQSEMSKALYTNNHRNDLKMVHGTNKQVVENCEIVKVVIDALLYTARQNIALRGHNEHKLSNKRGNFLELINLMGKYHPVLNLHLQKINSVSKNRISFLSNISQNKLLDIMKEYVRSIKLEEVKQSQMFSIIIDTTTDLSSLEQVVFVLRYV